MVLMNKNNKLSTITGAIAMASIRPIWAKIKTDVKQAILVLLCNL